MNNTFAKIKTKAAGIFTGASGIVGTIFDAAQKGTFTGQHGFALAVSIGIVLMGYFSKPSGVTGGTVAVTPEATYRVAEDKNDVTPPTKQSDVPISVPQVNIPKA